MARSMERAEESPPNLTWQRLKLCPAGHKFEAITWSVFSAATTATWYLGILKLDTSTLIIDEIHMPSGFNVVSHSYSGVPITEGEEFRHFIAATGYVAASSTLSYIDVNYAT